MDSSSTLACFSICNCKAGRILKLLAQTGEKRQLVKLQRERERHSFNACLCAELIQGKEKEEEKEEEEEEEEEEWTEVLSLESDAGANLLLLSERRLLLTLHTT